MLESMYVTVLVSGQAQLRTVDELAIKQVCILTGR